MNSTFQCVQLLMDQTQVAQQLLLLLPMEDVVGYFEGILFAKSQKQRPHDEVHASIFGELPWQ